MKYTVVDILNKFLAFTRFCKSILLRELNKQQPFLNKDIFLTSCFASFCRQKLSWRHSYASVSCDYVNNEIRLWEKKNKLCLAFYTMRCYKYLVGIYWYLSVPGRVVKTSQSAPFPLLQEVSFPKQVLNLFTKMFL